MTHRRTFFAVALAVCASGFLMSWLGGALAITENNYLYTTPKTARLILHSAAFVPDGLGTIERRSYGIVATSGTPCVGANVNLPQGATITGVTMWYFSTVAGGPVLSMVRTRLSDANEVTIATATGNDTTATRTAKNATIDAASAVINNNLYAYTVNVCPAANDVFQTVRITYTYTNAGD